MRRIFKYDFIRVVSMFLICILNIETIIGNCSEVTNFIGVLSTTTKTICVAAIGLFFMLSGYFNLNKNYKTKHDYFDFYTKRIIYLIIPFMLVLLLYIFILYSNQHLSISSLLELTLGNQIHNSFIYMFYLGTYLFSAPFLALMVNNMDKKDKKIFVLIFVTIDLLLMLKNITGFHASFDKGTFPLMNYCFYFVLGAMIDDVFDSDKIQKVMILLLPIVIISKTIINYFYPNSIVLTGLNPLFTLEVIGMYFLLIKVSKQCNIYIKKIINRLSKHSFTFYLINPLLITLLSKYFSLSQDYIQIVLFIISIILSSIVISWILDELIIKRITQMFWLFYRKVVIKQREVEICDEK